MSGVRTQGGPIAALWGRLRTQPRAASAAARRAAGATGLLLLVAAAFAAAPAQAHQTHLFSTSFGQGTLTNPYALGLDQSNGHLYVTDAGSAQVFAFDSAGSPLAGFGTGGHIDGSATPTGSFGVLRGLAVDSSASASAHDVYVADASNGVIDKFGPSGNYLCQITGQGSGSGSASECDAADPPPAGAPALSIPVGLGVDNAGRLYVGDLGSSTVDVFDSAGKYLASFPSTASSASGPLGDIAIDPSGSFYTADGGIAEIYDPFPSGAQAGSLPGASQPGAVAVDPQSGEIFLADSASRIDAYDSARNPQPSFGADANPPLGAELFGIAAYGATHGVYLADFDHGVIDLFGPGVTLADVTTGAATNIGPASVTLNGTIDADGGGDASCQFQYVTDSQFGVDAYASASTAPCSTDPVTGSGPVSETTSPDPLSGLTPNTTYHFRVVATNANGTTDGSDQTFTTPPSVQLATGAPSEVLDTSATLGGTLNPQGQAISDCHFDYIDDQSFQLGVQYAAGDGYGLFFLVKSAPCLNPDGSDASTIPPDGLDHPVHADLSALSANTTYHFRLSATNAFGTTTGSDETFTTLFPLIPPSIDSTSVANVASTSADLRAQVNPNHYDTAYHFEYVDDATFQADQGSGDGFQHAASAPSSSEVGLGSDATDQSASQHLSGLSPATTYHYRVLAHNRSGPIVGPARAFTTQSPASSGPDTCSNAQFRTGSAAKLPDCRAYEMVSPIDKNGGDITGITSVTNKDEAGSLVQAAADGNSITYTSKVAFGDAQAAPFDVQYLASHGPSGWSSHGVNTPMRNLSQAFVGTGAPYKAFSTDLAIGLMRGAQDDSTIPGSDAPPGHGNYYLRDNATGGFQALVTNANLAQAPAFANAAFQGATPDLSHIVVQGQGGSLWEWSAGQFQPIAPSNATFGNYTVAATSPSHAISDDGSRVFWSLGPNLALYLHDLNTQTDIQVDASQEGPPVDPSEQADSVFSTASTDGSKAFFTSHAPLTPDADTGPPCGGGCVRAGNDLYRYDAGSGQLTDLTPDGADPNGAKVQGVLGASADGSYLYFVANGALAAGGTSGQPNLYLWHDDGTPHGSIAFIATLSADDNASGQAFTGVHPVLGCWCAAAGDWSAAGLFRTARVTPDGRHLAFMSSADLTGYDSAGPHCVPATTDEHVLTGYGPGRCQEVYLYDANSGQLTCASCNPTGAQPTGPSSVPAWTPISSFEATYQSRYLRDDGNRLFFDSADALAPQDTNGHQDVYQWEAQGTGTCHRVGGCIDLISSGQTPDDSSFVDASASGDDVFFVTAASLLSQDPGLVDLYDARVSGGFPPPPPPPPSCQGDACQTPSTPPADPTLATSVPSGPGNPPSTFKRHHRRPHHHHHHHARPIHAGAGAHR